MNQYKVFILCRNKKIARNLLKRYYNIAKHDPEFCIKIDSKRPIVGLFDSGGALLSTIYFVSHVDCYNMVRDKNELALLIGDDEFDKRLDELEQTITNLGKLP